MCTGRVDLSFILRALSGGADGVFIGGCWPGECHYVTEGNYDALANLHLSRMLMTEIGVSPKRLRLEWIAASEGARFAEVMNDFVATLVDLGPLGATGDPELRGRIEAVSRLVPYIKLVERERLRPPVRTEEAYNAFYESAQTRKLFDALIVEKLVATRITQVLSDSPLSTAQLSERLGLSPSDVSRHMISASRQGLVRYDTERKRYALGSMG